MKRKMEFSKIIMLVTSAVTISVTAFSCYMIFETKDLSPLSYLIPAIFAEMGVATGFYYSKAKVENRIKLRKKYGAEIYNDVKGDSYD